MATRVFTSFEDETITIAGEVWDLRPLPSGKAVKLTDMAQDFQKAYEILAEDIKDDENSADTIAKVGVKILDSRYYIIAFGLQIEKDSDDFNRLKACIDKASWPEIFWVINQILQVNGSQQLENLIKNSLSRLEPLIPDLRDAITASLRRFSRNQELQEKLQNLRSTGSTLSSQDSEEDLSSIPQNISSIA